MLLVKLEPMLLSFGRWLAFEGPSNIAAAIERSLSIERPKLEGLFYRQPSKAAVDQIRAIHSITVFSFRRERLMGPSTVKSN